MFIYCIRHRRTGKEYVGITTTTPAVRWSLHQSAARCGSSMLIHQALRSEGIEAFEMELLGHADSIEDLWRMEEQAIREHRTLHPNGYNRAGGKPQFPRQKWTAAARERLKDVRRRQVTEDLRERLRASHVGKRHSTETRAKMSRAQKGRPKSPAHVRNATHPQTPETRAKLSSARRLWWASKTATERSAIQRERRIIQIDNQRREAATGAVA